MPIVRAKMGSPTLFIEKVDVSHWILVLGRKTIGEIEWET